MTKISGKKVLITGGASGIGRQTGERMLEKGAALLLIWDINEAAAAETMEYLRAKGYRSDFFRVDVSDTGQVTKAAAEVLEKYGSIDILVNNAGVVVGKDFHENSHEEIEFVMNINTLAYMHVTREFLPSMIREKSGHIVNISSAAGLLSNPRMSVYAGSKWAVYGWSESLRIEQEKMKSRVKVSTICPSYISTGLFEGVRMVSLIPILTAEKLSRKIVRTVEKDRITLKTPFMVRLIPFVKGILPIRWFDWFAGEFLRVYHSMDHFIGHKKN